MRVQTRLFHHALACRPGALCKRMAYYHQSNRGVHWDAYWRPPVVPLSPIYRLNPCASRRLEYGRPMPNRLVQASAQAYDPPRSQPPPRMQWPPLPLQPPPSMPPPPPMPPAQGQRPRTEQQRVPVEKVALFKSKGIPDGFIVLLAEKGSILLQTTFNLRVVSGLVYCYGHLFRPSDRSCNLYSPGPHTSVELSDVPSGMTLQREERAMRRELDHRYLCFHTKKSKPPSCTIGTPLLKRPPPSGNVAVDLPEVDCCAVNAVLSRSEYRGVHLVAVFVLQPNRSPLIPFVISCAPHCPSYKEYFQVKDDKVFDYMRVVPRTEASGALKVPVTWFKLAHDISLHKGATVLLLGQANLGKSTLARFLTNFLLNSYPKVAFLECDVGQAEFTPFGTLALNLVDEPIIGPPFTHQRDPLRAHYFGDNTPSVQPEYYIRCIHSLAAHHQKEVRQRHPHWPLIVNTCGWLRDMGVALAIDVIRIVRPTHVIRLKLENESLRTTKFLHSTLPDLTAEYIETVPGLFTNGESELWKKYMKGEVVEGDVKLSDVSEGGAEGGGDFGRDGSGLPVMGDATQLWEGKENEGVSSEQDILRIFEISGILEEDLPEVTQQPPAPEPVSLPTKRKGSPEGAPEKKKKTKRSSPTTSSEKPTKSASAGGEVAPSQLWNKAGRFYVCNLQAVQFAKQGADNRLLGLLVYFSRFFSEKDGDPSPLLPPFTSPSPLAILAARPYEVKFKDVAIHTMRCEVPRSKILYSFYSSLVALAVADESLITSFEEQYPDMVKFINTRYPITDYVGFGIVRHIDVATATIYITTPTPEDQLQRVNLLLAGKNALPPFLYTMGGEKEERVPYCLKNFPAISLSFVTSLSFAQKHTRHN